VIAISEIVNGIEQKTQLLVAKLAVLEKENASLIEKNQSLLEQNRGLQADLLLRNSEISQLGKQVESQEGEGVEEYERKHYLRKEIDQYIQDIDKCIEWLQNA
jgi:poly(3-hydroxyalkanoate) synthetase